MNNPPFIETATHHGKLGDIIYAGPVLRAKKIRDLLLFSDEASAGMRMTTEAAEFLRPLLTSQDWCDCVAFAATPPYSHLPGFRHHTDKHGCSLVGSHLSTYGLHDVLRHAEFPWLKVEPKPVAKLVVARTDRWVDRSLGELNFSQIVDMFPSAVFVGTDDEYLCWQDRYGDIIPRHICYDALELAQVIAGADALVSTPSLPAAIACGLRQTTFLECAPWFNAGWERPECAILHAGSKLTKTHCATILEVGAIIKRRYWNL